MFSEVDKKNLLARCGYHCEYCKGDSLTDYHIEHIDPVSLGGINHHANLAISCPRCNRNKGNRVVAEDPHTWLIVSLFNPRKDVWAVHFRRSHGEVVGVTPVGRATAALLFRNTSQTLGQDLRWDMILSFEDNDIIYKHFNNLRNWRLQNKFDLVLSELEKPSQYIHPSSSALGQVSFVRNFLRLEVLFTRSRPEDISSGINMARALVGAHWGDKEKANAFLSILSIFYRQKATLCALNGEQIRAGRFQKASARCYYLSHLGESSMFSPSTNAKNFLRYYSTAARYSLTVLPLTMIEEAFRTIADMDSYSSTTHLSYLMDSLRLREHVPQRFIDAVYTRVSRIIETEGYGTRNERDKMVTLRRRWWPLHFIADNSASIKMFDKDILMWSSIRMSNEIRELNDSLVTIKSKISTRRWKDIVRVLKRHLRNAK